MYGTSQEAILGNGNHKSFNFDPEPVPDYFALTGDEAKAQVDDLTDDERDMLAEYGF